MPLNKERHSWQEGWLKYCKKPTYILLSVLWVELMQYLIYFPISAIFYTAVYLTNMAPNTRLYAYVTFSMESITICQYLSHSYALSYGIYNKEVRTIAIIINKAVKHLSFLHEIFKHVAYHQ